MLVSIRFDVYYVIQKFIVIDGGCLTRWLTSILTPDFNFDHAILIQEHQQHNMASLTSEVPNYDEEVDFQALAMTDPDFAKFYDDANGLVDFQDPKALQQVILHFI